MTQTAPIDPTLDRVQRPALIVGAIGLLACIIGVFLTPAPQFFLSYLFAYLFWLGIPLGCAALLMTQYLTGGAWGLPLRRLLEAGTRMLPLMAILFIPMFFAIGHLYHWSNVSESHAGYRSAFQAVYLQPGFFIVRALIYFAIWLLLAFFLNRWSIQEDHAPDPRLPRRFQFLSAPGLILYCLSMTFAAVDWIMSIDPRWFSTIFGFILITGQALSALAFVTIVAIFLTRQGLLANTLTPDTRQDIGNLLLTFTMLWAYMSFSQLLIIWSGNIEAETPYYIYRAAGGWLVLAVLLIFVHFFIPFLLLLSRSNKRSLAILTGIAALLVVMRIFDLFWMVAPAYAQGQRISP
ncbi:MAG TPA: hypothetical protein VHP11_09155, partial [Tepidisphaeraceae bacterium]|nr:hypothetical protein [Tepidisphaeraceae bacterium]